jgi:hypothetical protein
MNYFNFYYQEEENGVAIKMTTNEKTTMATRNL